MAETSGMKWYVLRAVSGKEGKVKEFIDNAKKHNDILESHVGEVLLPTEKYAMLRNGKRVIKEKLFLPGYVLVQASLQGEVAHMLRFIPNVLGFLGGMDNPTPVKQSDINRILGVAEETEIKSEEISVPYMVDEAVKVTDGPFSGFSGIIEEVNAEKHKLKVMVKIFGRKTPLELNYNQVEKE
jgi:transcriptional antiterminator NusG